MPVEDFRSVVYMGCDFILFACTNTFNQNASVTCAEVMNISHLLQQLVYPFGECFLALSCVIIFNYIISNTFRASLILFNFIQKYDVKCVFVRLV